MLRMLHALSVLLCRVVGLGGLVFALSPAHVNIIADYPHIYKLFCCVVGHINGMFTTCPLVRDWQAIRCH